MKKILIIFGSDGFLGSGVTSVLLKKNYDDYYLFDFKFRNKIEQANVYQFQIEDLSRSTLLCRRRERRIRRSDSI